MFTTLKPVPLLCATLIVLAVIGSTSVLVIHGYASDASTVPIVLVALVPLFVRQERLHQTASDTNAKVADALNGGLERAVTRSLTRMAAKDERAGTSTVADAAAGLPTTLPPDPAPPAPSTAP